MKKSQKYLRWAAVLYSLLSLLALGIFCLLYAIPIDTIDKTLLIYLAIVGVALWILASIMRASYRQAQKEEKVEEIDQFIKRMEAEKERIENILNHIDNAKY